jgi:nitroreductase
MPQQEYDQLLTLVKNRQTIRKFKPDSLPEGPVEKIIEVACRAPSGFHTQPWEFVVVQKKEVKDAIVCALDGHAPPIKNIKSGAETSGTQQPSFRDSPVFIILLIEMVLGYPAAPPNRKELRELDAMIHYDDCGFQDFRTDEQVFADAQTTWDWCMSEH